MPAHSNEQRVTRPAHAGPVTRRQLIQTAGVFGAALALEQLAPAYAWADARRKAVQATPGALPGDHVIDLAIDAFPLRVDGRTGRAIAVNGSVPEIGRAHV